MVYQANSPSLTVVTKLKKKSNATTAATDSRIRTRLSVTKIRSMFDAAVGLALPSQAMNKRFMSQPTVPVRLMPVATAVTSSLAQAILLALVP